MEAWRSDGQPDRGTLHQLVVDALKDTPGEDFVNLRRFIREQLELNTPLNWLTDPEFMKMMAIVERLSTPEGIADLVNKARQSEQEFEQQVESLASSDRIMVEEGDVLTPEQLTDFKRTMARRLLSPDLYMPEPSADCIQARYTLEQMDSNHISVVAEVAVSPIPNRPPQGVWVEQFTLRIERR